MVGLGGGDAGESDATRELKAETCMLLMVTFYYHSFAPIKILLLH